MLLVSDSCILFVQAPVMPIFTAQMAVTFKPKTNEALLN